MEPVMVTCRECGQAVPVGAADRGNPVLCPFCYQPIQVPAPTADHPALGFGTTAPAESESIFTPPEAAGDDLFGAPARPLVEMPADAGASPSAKDLERAFSEAPTIASALPPAPPSPPVETSKAWPDVPHVAGVSQHAQEPGESLPTREAHAGPGPAKETAPHAAELPSGLEFASAAVTRRPAAKRSLGTLLLILLIPYAIFTTAAIAWLVYQQRQAAPFDPLERLPDPKPGEGGPKRVKYNAPLSERLKAPLNKTLQVGDVAVTPLLVERSAEGELLLKLRLKNVSQDTAFDPLPNAFVVYKPQRGGGDLKPYTFIEFGEEAIFGGFVEWQQKPRRPEAEPFDGVLYPGEEAVAAIRTSPLKQPLAGRLERFQGEALWRVHVRRGFVTLKGREVSATAVIGVRLPAAMLVGLRGAQRR